MDRVVGVAAGMYTIARPTFGYSIGTPKLSVCSALGLVSDGLVAFLHLAPPNAMSATLLIKHVIEQMNEYRQLAGISGAHRITRVYGLQGGSMAFGQILETARVYFGPLFEELPAEAFSYSPTFRGFALDPKTGEASKPPETAFVSRHPRVVGFGDPRYGFLERLLQEGLIK